MRPALVLTAALAASLGTAHAQAPRPLPARIRAAVGLPGTAALSFANVTLDLGPLPWTMVGCTSRLAGTCFATQRVTLTDADRAALVTRVQEVLNLGRCGPLGGAPGEPAYTIDFPAAHYAGHLPADPAAIPARTSDPCAAPSRLAWWLAERFTAGTRPGR